MGKGEISREAISREGRRRDLFSKEVPPKLAPGNVDRKRQRAFGMRLSLDSRV